MKTVEFTSAQNVRIEYELASVGQRAAAALIDFFIFVVYAIIFSMVVFRRDLFGSFGLGSREMVFALLLKIPFVLYHPIVEYLTGGLSLGKYILGIRVVTMEGESPGLREVFTRWLFKGDFVWLSASGLVLLWFGIGIIGSIYAGTSSRRQRLADLMANTLVIRNKSNVRYSLNDVLSIKNKDSYSPIYPNVTRFTDDDMLLIKNTIQRVKKYPNEETKRFAVELADKAATLIGLEETPKKRLEFLQTLLQDYVVLTR